MADNNPYKEHHHARYTPIRKVTEKLHDWLYTVSKATLYANFIYYVASFRLLALKFRMFCLNLREALDIA